ncbi:response regulator transcription factor [Paenibacillus yanchengensis]|uniref:Response regulator transcription factor n=1 Tax=Paenibacillus yanchengensis TaxID=2035833 RepID=A0ABW4YP74_9BACL
MEQTILIVEDEEKIARLLQIELEIEGYKVVCCNDGFAGLTTFREQSFDLVLLDIMLPNMNGIEVLRRIRTNDQVTPVILLTAKDTVEDKVTGLDDGANDYITKPFQIEELFARIRAVLRQSLAKKQGTVSVVEADEVLLQVADLTVNEKTRDVRRANQIIELTPREFDLLVYLLKNKRQVLHREQILEAVWGFDYYGETNIVDVYIRYLRKKIEQGQEMELIHTVRGIGYVLKEAN